MTGDELGDRFVAYLQAFAVGARQAQTALTLCAALGLEPNEQSRRILRRLCVDAIGAGHLVCSGQRGYFVPATPGEALTATSRLRSEAYELMRRARKADQLAAERFCLQDEPEPARETPALLALMEA
jgi:hypothetical protein